MVKKITGITLITMLLFSCSNKLDIAKRKYNDGYYVQITNGNNKASTQAIELGKKVIVKLSEEKTSELKSNETSNSSEDICNGVVASNEKETAIITSIKAKNGLTNYVAKRIVKNQITRNANLLSEAKTLDANKTATVSKKKTSAGNDVPTGILVVLCFIMPWLAVGLKTNWDGKKVLFSILWTLLCGIPGIIYALRVVLK